MQVPSLFGVTEMIVHEPSCQIVALWCFFCSNHESVGISILKSFFRRYQNEVDKSFPVYSFPI